MLNFDFNLKVPCLGIGKGPADGSRMCAMQVISWLYNDSEITDVPECVDPLLAWTVQRVNDTYCTHNDGLWLCQSCSADVLDLAHRTIDTNMAGVFSEAEIHRVYVAMALRQARSIEHLAESSAVVACNDKAQRWFDGTATADDVADAAKAVTAGDQIDFASCAVDAAIDAAGAVLDDFDAATSASKTVLNALMATCWARDCLSHAHEVIDEFERLTSRNGHTGEVRPSTCALNVATTSLVA